MSDITEIIEHVATCAVPDRVIDGEIFFIFEWAEKGNGREVPEYTASLDAVVALIEKAMPGALWEVNGYGAACVYPHWAAGDAETKFSETNKEAHIALLLAFLRAKESLSA